MRAEEFHRYVGVMPYGKTLPGARYIFRPNGNNLSGTFLAVVKRAETAASPPPDWNLLKLHTNEFAVTFLSYPEFDADPHPALAEATKINLNTGSVIRTDYRPRANPPILHRKETFLPAEDPRVANYAALTAREEEVGLYHDPSKIGLRVQWLTLLKRLGLTHEDAIVPVRKQIVDAVAMETDTREIKRHRTAIKRYDLSKPVKQLLERGLLKKGDTFFDFGCGHGMDIEALQNLGYLASGWDPAFRPNAPKLRAGVVNLGFVLNVIEEPSERIATLRRYVFASRARAARFDDGERSGNRRAFAPIPRWLSDEGEYVSEVLRARRTRKPDRRDTRSRSEHSGSWRVRSLPKRRRRGAF